MQEEHKRAPVRQSICTPRPATPPVRTHTPPAQQRAATDALPQTPSPWAPPAHTTRLIHTRRLARTPIMRGRTHPREIAAPPLPSRPAADVHADPRFRVPTGMTACTPTWSAIPAETTDRSPLAPAAENTAAASCARAAPKSAARRNPPRHGEHAELTTKKENTRSTAWWSTR